jgi:hypothetical protein
MLTLYKELRLQTIANNKKCTCELFPYPNEQIFTPICILHMQIAFYNAYGWLRVDNALLFCCFDGFCCKKFHWFTGEEFIVNGCDFLRV